MKRKWFGAFLINEIPSFYSYNHNALNDVIVYVEIWISKFVCFQLIIERAYLTFRQLFYENKNSFVSASIRSGHWFCFKRECNRFACLNRWNGVLKIIRSFWLYELHTLKQLLRFKLARQIYLFFFEINSFLSILHNVQYLLEIQQLRRSFILNKRIHKI